MVQLRQLRIDNGWTLAQMSEKLKISKRTLTRIEASERKGEKHPMEVSTIAPLVKAINEVFKQSYTAQDFKGIELAPPRPGRPRKREGNA